jgi:hypothetical protein
LFNEAWLSVPEGLLSGELRHTLELRRAELPLQVTDKVSDCGVALVDVKGDVIRTVDSDPVNDVAGLSAPRHNLDLIAGRLGVLYHL